MEAKLREIIATYLEQLPMAKVVAEKSQKPQFFHHFQLQFKRMYLMSMIISII